VVFLATLLQALGGIFGEEYELRVLHKILHVLSKVLFYLALASLFQPLVQVIRNYGFGMLLLYDKVVSYAVSLAFIFISLAIAFGAKEAFTHSLLSDLRISLKDLSEVLPRIKPKTPFLDAELLPSISDHLSGYLERNVSFRKVIKTSYFKVSMLINFFLIPIALLILLVSNGYEPTYPWYNLLSLSVFLVLLALFISFINAWLIISTCELRGVEDEVKEEGQEGDIKRGARRKAINLLFLVVLTRYKCHVGEKLELKEKVLISFWFSIGLTFLISPGDLLIPSRREEQQELQLQPRNVAFVFTPSLSDLKGLPGENFPGVCSGEGKEDERVSIKNENMKLLNRICITAYNEIGLTPKCAKGYDINKTNFIICTSADWSNYKLERVHEELIQHSEIVLDNLINEISTTLNGWIIEFLTFEDLKSLLKTNNAEEVIERLYKYSIVKTSRKIWSTIDTIDRVFGLFSDKELINDLGDLSEKFMFVIPIINIRSEQTPVTKVITRIHAKKSFFITYYCIPVLIALNPLMNPRDFEELYSKIRARTVNPTL
jgi:hypothetical protein